MEDFLGIIRQLADEKHAAGFVRPEGQAGDVFKDVYIRRVPKADEAGRTKHVM